MERALLGFGLATTGAGLLLVLTPLSVSVGAPWALVVAAVAVLALGVGGLAAAERSVTGPSRATLPTPDDRRGVEPPGAAFDERLATLDVGDDEAQATVRERLEAVAVPLLADCTDCSRETARERLQDGRWTDDPLASAFFAGDPPSRRERVRTVLTGEPTAARRARRVVAELTALAEADR